MLGICGNTSATHRGLPIPYLHSVQECRQITTSFLSLTLKHVTWLTDVDNTDYILLYSYKYDSVGLTNFSSFISLLCGNKREKIRHHMSLKTM